MFEPDDVTKPVETLPPSTGESKAGAVMESGSDPMPEPAVLAHAAADHVESSHAEVTDTEEEGHAPATAHAEPEPPAPEPVAEEAPPENPKHWYVVKVQSGREDTIVVLVTVVMMAVFLFGMDYTWKILLSSKPVGVLHIPKDTNQQNKTIEQQRW